MKVKFNEQLLLWALGVIQPACARDIVSFISEIYPHVPSLPELTEIESYFSGWRDAGIIERVHAKSRYYSLSYQGDLKLSRSLRKLRDRARLFLLKKARNAKIITSGEEVQELTGVSPVMDSSISLQEGGRPIISAAAPRLSRTTAELIGRLSQSSLKLVLIKTLPTFFLNIILFQP